MRPGLVASLLISLVLVGGATWVRFSPKDSVSEGLTVVSSSGVSATQDDPSFLDKFLGTSSSEAPKSVTNEPLTGSDILSRQLVSEYISLATNGGGTDAELQSLADKYISSIPSLTTSTIVDYIELKTVTNTKDNFQRYADLVTKIHRTYASSIQEAYAGTAIDSLGQKLYSVTDQLSSIYTKTSTELKNTSVPYELAPAHLRLINLYLSNASSLKAISNTETDSATAFAGLLVVNKNAEEEATILGEITRILTANGI